MSHSIQKDILIIAGPTASGKSAMAMDVAEKFNGTIINADSMQIYADLRIITARPTIADETRVPHMLYGALDGCEVCSAQRWRDMALDAIEHVLAEGRLPIICGGTGMYLKTLTEGMSPIPDIPEELRREVRQRLDEIGSSALHGELAEIDTVMADRLNAADSQRVARALEVIKATGRSLAKWQDDPPVGPPSHLKFTTIALVPPRDILYERCDRRFGEMLKLGALGEVEKLMQRSLDTALPVMRALGVPELIAYLKDEMSLEEAEIKACTLTRRYAKRQNTWINNQIISKKTINAQYSEKLKAEIFAFICEKNLTN